MNKAQQSSQNREGAQLRDSPALPRAGAEGSTSGSLKFIRPLLKLVTYLACLRSGVGGASRPVLLPQVPHPRCSPVFPATLQGRP